MGPQPKGTGAEARITQTGPLGTLQQQPAPAKGQRVRWEDTSHARSLQPGRGCLRLLSGPAHQCSHPHTGTHWLTELSEGR